MASDVVVMPRTLATPLILPDREAARPLRRMPLRDVGHNENWLQAHLSAYPALIPMADIEPGFGDLVSVAREVPCGHGRIDNIYLTPDGDIVLVEAKLWSNPQARREVVAQTLDYVAAITGMGYEGFERCVLAGQLPIPATTLYDFVRDHPEAPDEDAFVNAVARNIERGRLVALVVGDGIHAEAERLGDLLQSHAGAHFTFAMVELSSWRDDEGRALLIVPHVLARTVMIERGIVRLEGEGLQVVAAALPASRSAKPTAQSITEQDFYAALAAKDPRYATMLQAFVVQLEPLGVRAETQKTLNLKIDVAGYAKSHNLGYISTVGKLRTSMLGWTAGEDIAFTYSQQLAALTGGTVATHDGIYLATANGKSMPRIDVLLPEHADAWGEAIRDVIGSLERRASEGAG